MKHQTPLPIDTVLTKLLSACRNHPNCILHAPPGAGKTTRVPLTLLDIIPASAGRIIILEPRRLAAVSAARWMAELIGEEVGQTVGFTIRFESKVSPATRVEVVTEGVLTRRIQNDPLLEGVAMLIFDEFHERSLQADLGLALSLDVQRQVRQDLKILVMSATLDADRLSDLLGGAQVVTSEGRSYPVEEIFLEGSARSPLPQSMAAAIMQAVRERNGDILAFLPGAGEIRSCSAMLAEAGCREHGIAVHQLYGDMSFDRQQAAILPGRQRRVILATNIAETSLTIEGISIVVDSGLSRRVSHDRTSGMNRLVTVRESRSSAVQRGGRSGRTGPGVCYRLFSRSSYSAMTPQTPPEILDSDLSGLLLELAAWGCSNPLSLSWLDPPPAASLSAARILLQDLGALDSLGRITSLGTAMAALPLHPRLARLLLRSRELECVSLGCDLAALLAERDIVRSGSTHLHHSCDVAERVDVLRTFRKGGSYRDRYDAAAIKSVDRAAVQLRRLAGVADDGVEESKPDELIGSLLLAAYPDRVAMRRGAGEGRYLLSNGSGAAFRQADVLSECRLLVVPNLSGSVGKDAVIRLAAEITVEKVVKEQGHRLQTVENVSWDEREGRVIAIREERLGGICLSSWHIDPGPAHFVSAVTRAVQGSSLSLLTLDDRFRQLQSRMLLVRSTFPDDGWPDTEDSQLSSTVEFWLAPHLSGIRTLRQLSAVDCAGALYAMLDYQHRIALDSLAPTHITVPSGSRIRLDYCAGVQPVLAVKIQELFGLADTPTVAKGRVAVLLHLLSPAGRPLQVTQDLKGFWDGSYHQVKKEMKGRYPKHPWPDDPWNAIPTRRAKPRGS